MKKIILTTFCLLFLLGAKAQTTTRYFELNMGFSTGIIPFFPGSSALYGATTKYNSGILLDYEAGIAFPTLVTAKGGIGYDIDGTEVSVGVRPWPPATYGQVRLNRPNKFSDIVLSVENMMWSNDFLGQRAMFTIGWRFDNKRYSDIKHK